MGFLTAWLASRLTEKGASHGFQTLLTTSVDIPPFDFSFLGLVRSALLFSQQSFFKLKGALSIPLPQTRKTSILTLLAFLFFSKPFRLLVGTRSKYVDNKADLLWWFKNYSYTTFFLGDSSKVHCPSSTVAICSISPGIESSIGSFDGPVDLQKLAPLSLLEWHILCKILTAVTTIALSFPIGLALTASTLSD